MYPLWFKIQTTKNVLRWLYHFSGHCKLSTWQNSRITLVIGLQANLWGLSQLPVSEMGGPAHCNCTIPWLGFRHDKNDRYKKASRKIISSKWLPKQVLHHDHINHHANMEWKKISYDSTLRWKARENFLTEEESVFFRDKPLIANWLSKPNWSDLYK